MNSIRQFLSYMNDISFKYVVLRNWESLPFDVCLGEHSDLDLLVYDFDHFFEIFPQAKLEHKLPRVRTKIPIDDSYIYVDVRSIGDNYYPIDLQKAILETREYNSRGFYTPNPLHHRIALAYHAVHHKGNVSQEYTKYLGDSNVEELLDALKTSNVGWVEPKDKTVGAYYGYWKGATSVVSINDGRVIKKQINYTSNNLLENEYRILSHAVSNHFPKVYNYSDGSLEMEHCGEPLEDNIPDNWEEQLNDILKDLKANNILHRDIRIDNLTVKDKIIYLIDFGWAKIVGEEERLDVPSCLGYPNKSSEGFSDAYSMGCVKRQLEYQLEEMETAK